MLLRQAGWHNEEWANEFILLLHLDLGTVERVLGLQVSCSQQGTSLRDMQIQHWVNVPGPDGDYGIIQRTHDYDPVACKHHRFWPWLRLWAAGFDEL